MKIFGGGGGQGGKDIVGILLLNELCWDEIDDITHDSPTAFSFFLVAEMVVFRLQVPTTYIVRTL